MARNMNMRPLPGSMQMMVSQTPENYLAAIRQLQLGAKISGMNEDVIRRAQTSRHQLAQKEAEAQALTSQAQFLVERSRNRFAELDAWAQGTSDRLVAAQDALQAARARTAAAEAAALRAAAARARDQAARSRAAALERAARSSSQSTGVRPARASPGTGNRTVTSIRPRCA
jgi:hypothetical protein